jgi:hypothetical protein
LRPHPPVLERQACGELRLPGDKAWPRDEPRDCYKVEVSGDVVTFYDKDGSGLRYTLLKGNPKKL